jgi:osmotically inducible lipoprotein OsmB
LFEQLLRVCDRALFHGCLHISPYLYGLFIWSGQMKYIQIFPISIVATLVVMGVVGCSGMSAQDKNTAVGAGVGGVAGSVLTGGSTAGTIGGAAVGGIIGHEVDTPKK